MTHQVTQAEKILNLPLLLFLCGVLASGNNFVRTQTKPAKHAQQNNSTPSSTKWVEGRVSVKVELPYLSDSGNLVLAYTVTNKSGEDITLDFTENPPFSTRGDEQTRVFLRLKEPPSFSQVTPKDHFLFLSEKLLPADLPVLFHVVVSVADDDKPSWFSSKSAEDRLRELLKRKLGNADSIAVFVPDRHLKIVLPVPSGPRK